MSQSALSFEDGGTALLRDPRQVPVKLRRPYDHAVMAFSALAMEAQNGISAATPEEREAEEKRRFVIAAAAHPELDEARTDALTLALVAEWSYGPVNSDTLANLPASTYDALVEACEKLAPQLSPRFAVSPDPKATTAA